MGASQEPITAINVTFGVYAAQLDEDSPPGCPFLEALEVELQGDVILKGADLPIEQAVIREESYCGLHGVMIL